MTHRLEQQAKRASLIALIVLIGALFLNINIGEINKMAFASNGPIGTFWQGSDGNVWVAGENGANNAGVWDSNTQDYWSKRGYDLTPDPVNFTVQPATDWMKQQSNTTGTDPFSQWGGADNFNNMRSGFNTQKQGILNSANTAAQQRGLEYKQSIDRWGLGAKQAQQGLDNRGINAEMAKSQGIKGVLGMVGRGIRSSGVMLANKNAGDSSAAGALANAYGDVGRRQASGVNNAYGLEMNQIGLDQQNLEAGNALTLKEFEDNKQTVVNTIVSEAENALAALDAQIAGASLPDRIAIEQEKQNIRNNAMAQLTQYDSTLAEQRAKANPIDANARRTEAARLGSLGQASNMDFGYTTDVPGQFQGSGPYSSELPVFTYGSRRRY